MTKDLPKNFCIAPWVSLYLDPEGNLGPCCIAKKDELPNINVSSFNTIRQTYIKELQNKFLNNEKPSVCSDCWRHEENNQDASSLRHNFNKTYEKQTQEVLNDIYDNKIYYWDLRPNNSCNLGCLMCSSTLSSGFVQLMQDIKIFNSDSNKFLKVDGETFDELFSFMKESIENTKEYQIYFAGGEPIMSQQHKSIIEWLHENNYDNVRLRYNTNGTILSYKGSNFVDLWKDWNEHVDIDLSIDSSGIAGEFQRFGSEWNRISNNIEILSNSNNVWVTYNITIGLLTFNNLLNTIDSIEKLDTKDNLNHRVSFTPILGPSRLDIRMIPKDKLDLSILDELSNRGYNIDSLKNIINRYQEFYDNIKYLSKDFMKRESQGEFTITELWEQNKKMFNELRDKKNKDVRDFLPWIKEYIGD